MDHEETVHHYFKTYLGDITPTTITDQEQAEQDE